jgi:hypothetical protein
LVVSFHSFGGMMYSQRVWNKHFKMAAAAHVVERFNLPLFPLFLLAIISGTNRKKACSDLRMNDVFTPCLPPLETRSMVGLYPQVMIRSLPTHPHPKIYPYDSDKICSDLCFIRSYNRSEQGHSLESLHPWLFSDQGLPSRGQPQTSPRTYLIFKLVLAMKQSRFDISLEADGTTALLT